MVIECISLGACADVVFRCVLWCVCICFLLRWATIVVRMRWRCRSFSGARTSCRQTDWSCTWSVQRSREYERSDGSRVDCAHGALTVHSFFCFRIFFFISLRCSILTAFFRIAPVPTASSAASSSACRTLLRATRSARRLRARSRTTTSRGSDRPRARRSSARRRLSLSPRQDTPYARGSSRSRTDITAI